MRKENRITILRTIAHGLRTEGKTSFASYDLAPMKDDERAQTNNQLARLLCVAMHTHVAPMEVFDASGKLSESITFRIGA